MSNTDSVQWMGRMHRSGGSLAVILPKPLHEKLGLKRGDYMAIVEIEPDGACPDTRLLLRPVLKRMVLDRDLPPAEERPDHA